jgi:hypothetical protein
MVAQLRAKPGGEHIVVTMGDFADMAVEGRFIYNDWPVTILA